jgi:membrane associated rhomboid family serine protease
VDARRLRVEARRLEETFPSEAMSLLDAVISAQYDLFPWTYVRELPAHRYRTLVTYMFIHGGWLHILGNMWCLPIFGPTKEIY